MNISEMTVKEVIDFIVFHWDEMINDDKNLVSKMFTDEFNKEEFRKILNKYLQ